MREVPKAKFLAAFFLTAFIFLLIIVTNNYFNEIKINQLNSIYNNLRIDALNAEIQYEIISENPCVALNFDPISNELAELGDKLTSMETQLGKQNQQVLDLKKYYSILEIRQWLFVKKVSQECGKDAIPVLYFYSNEEDCATCDSQGFVLNYLKSTMPNVYIYSFDVNLDSSAVRTLKATYSITTAPSLVIREQLYVGFRDSDELLRILGR
jgi:hypothetical protein